MGVDSDKTQRSPSISMAFAPQAHYFAQTKYLWDLKEFLADWSFYFSVFPSVVIVLYQKGKPECYRVSPKKKTSIVIIVKK